MVTEKKRESVCAGVGNVHFSGEGEINVECLFLSSE